MVTSLTGEHQIRQAVMAGVAGYVVQGGTLDTYVDAVRALGQGMRYVCRRASQELMESVSQATLTTREREVLCPLVRGLANKAIARELGISVGTVKVHVRAILDKLQASSRTQAASVAVQRGLIEAAAGQPEAHRGAGQVAVSLRETRPRTKCIVQREHPKFVDMLRPWGLCTRAQVILAAAPVVLQCGPYPHMEDPSV